MKRWRTRREFSFETKQRLTFRHFHPSNVCYTEVQWSASNELLHFEAGRCWINAPPADKCVITLSTFRLCLAWCFYTCPSSGCLPQVSHDTYDPIKVFKTNLEQWQMLHEHVGTGQEVPACSVCCYTSFLALFLALCLILTFPSGNKSPFFIFHRGVMNSASGDLWQEDWHSHLLPSGVTCRLSCQKCCVHSAGFISAQRNRGSERLGLSLKPLLNVLHVPDIRVSLLKQYQRTL